MTKIELQQINTRLAAENTQLRAERDTLKRQAELVPDNAQLYLHALSWLRECDYAKSESQNTLHWVSGYRPVRTVRR